MLTTEIVTRALQLANLQDDDADLRTEALNHLKEGIRKYSGAMGYAQDYIEHTPTSETFTIGKPLTLKGKRLSYTYDALPSLDDYENCGYVKDRDCFYKESNDTFYKIVLTGTDTYAWQSFITSDYAAYFQIVPEVIVYDLDSVSSIVNDECYNLKNVALNAFLRGCGDYVANPVAESIVKITIRDTMVGKLLRVIYGKLVSITDSSNICVERDYLDLIIAYVAYSVAKTAKMKDALSGRLSNAETKVLDKNEEQNYLIVPDAWL